MLMLKSLPVNMCCSCTRAPAHLKTSVCLSQLFGTLSSRSRMLCVHKHIMPCSLLACVRVTAAIATALNPCCPA